MIRPKKGLCPVARPTSSKAWNQTKSESVRRVIQFFSRTIENEMLGKENVTFFSIFEVSLYIHIECIILLYSIKFVTTEHL